MNILTESALPRAREFLAISALSLGAFAMAMNANVLAPLMPFLAEDPIYRGMAAEELAALKESSESQSAELAELREQRERLEAEAGEAQAEAELAGKR